MKTYTVFCRESSGTGTTWIGAVDAESDTEAKDKALDECADSWGMDRADIMVIGIAGGDVQIIEWIDQE